MVWMSADGTPRLKFVWVCGAGAVSCVSVSACWCPEHPVALPLLCPVLAWISSAFLFSLKTALSVVTMSWGSKTHHRSPRRLGLWPVIRHTHPAINTTQPPATSVGKSGVLFQEVDNTPPPPHVERGGWRKVLGRGKCWWRSVRGGGRRGRLN